MYIQHNLLVWKWIDEEFDIKWMYLLYFIFVDTAFLLCGADMRLCEGYTYLVLGCTEQTEQFLRTGLFIYSILLQLTSRMY